MTQVPQFDVVIQNARVFNNGDMPVTQDIGIRDGKIVAREPKLDTKVANEVIDATGMWAMPGLFDIQT